MTIPSPRLQSGVPEGSQGMVEAVQLQRSAVLGWVGVTNDPVDCHRLFDKRDDSHPVATRREDQWIQLVDLANHLCLSFAAGCYLAFTATFFFIDLSWPLTLSFWIC
jgi:hypothetical protein